MWKKLKRLINFREIDENGNVQCRFVNDPNYIYYWYNRLIREETRTLTNLYFKINEKKFENMDDDEII
jgi:hypothetical protein